jgi:hypothetical protein
MDYTVKTIAEIDDQLQAEATGKIENLSTSNQAEWKIWTWVLASAIRMFQVLQAAFISTINSMLVSSATGSKAWYASTIKNFELNNTLVVLPNGEAGYEISNPANRIVTHVAIIEDLENNKVLVKVAKTVDNITTALTEYERLMLFNYIESIKILGTYIELNSNLPDLIKYNITVYYDIAFDEATVQQSIIAALDNYRKSIDFNAIIYKQKFIDIFMHVPGVVTVNLNTLSAKIDGSETWTAIAVQYQLNAGYFNFMALDAQTNNSVLTLTPINEL